MTAAPDPGLPEPSTWDTEPAAAAALGYAAIQGPVWDRIVAARTSTTEGAPNDRTTATRQPRPRRRS